MKQVSIVLIFAIVCLLACKENKIKTAGLSPKKALSTFELPDGFKIELIASEPLISDPVAMEVDESGNIFVVEMHGYPLDTMGSGIIKLLVDTDGDGAPDKSTVFADNLRLPTGIMVWKQGILVVDVPDILYLEDTNLDGRADKKEVLITGLALTNPQHIANTPIFGLDNWIYVAHMGIVTPTVSMEFNDTGSNVRFVNAPSAKQLPRNADGRNIRFNLSTHQLEMLSGESQYGQTFDPWGHHFGTSNADHLFHEVIAARYLQRNPNLLVGDAQDHIPDHGEAAEVYPITKNPEHQLLTDVGVITSSCGVTWYQGGLFPDSFNNITFIAEPVHNLVHADMIAEKGATFTASRVYQKKEFLSSTDAWFRPVQFYIGPDGALYVIDYYREIIEHPEWMSDSINNSGALYNGADMGRIYRITPVNAASMNWCSQLKLKTASTAELVNLLGNKNIWWRRNAQRLLLDKKDPQTDPLLHKLLDTTNSPIAIVHALWTLQELKAIDAPTLRKAFLNPHPEVRENAIQIAELNFLILENDFQQSPFLKDDSLLFQLLRLQNDISAKVRYQLLCTLGEINHPQATLAWQNLLLNDIEDKWVQIAALSSSFGKEFELIEKNIPALSKNPSEGKRSFFQNCAMVVGLSGKATDIKKLIILATTNPTRESDWWQSACLKGLTKSIRQKTNPGLDLTNQRIFLLTKFSKSSPPLIRSAIVDLVSILPIEKNDLWNDRIAKSKLAALDNNADISYRIDGLRLLALDKNKTYASLYESLINSEQPEGLQKTALRAYNETSGKDACNYIIANWKYLTPGVRDVAMDVFLSSVYNMNSLLDAVQKKQIQSVSISWPKMVQLMNNDDLDIRKRARSLLVDKIDSREEVFKRYQPSLTMKGDAENGLAVFKTVCSNCHNVGNQYGKTFGPDLASIRNRNAEFIMLDILDPNRSIADRFETWTVIKKTGEKFNGILASETPTTLTFHSLSGDEFSIARNEIKTMESSETSSMPVGLEKSLSVKNMADLLAFLKNIH